MANLATLRGSLATSLGAAGRVVYAYPKEQIANSAIVLVPASPYIIPVAIGGLSNRLNVRFDVTAIVGAADNQAALANLETLMLDVLNALPTGVAIISPWAQPSVTQVGASEMVTSQITIEVVTTNNGN